MALLIRWLVLTFSFVVAGSLVDGFQLKGGLGNQLRVSALFALLHLLLGWLLFLLIGVGTFGLGFVLAFVTRLVATALVLQLTASMTDKLKVRSFGSALFAALVIGITGTVTDWVLQALGLG